MSEAPPNHLRRALLLTLLGVALVWAALWVKHWTTRDGEGLILAHNRLETVARREALLSKGIYAEAGFQRLQPARPGEWLYEHPEGGQTFDEYRLRPPLTKSEARAAIVLQPFEPLSEPARANLEAVRSFTEAFFGLPTRLADPLPLPEGAIVASRGQYNSALLLDLLEARKPADALIYAGVLDEDLFVPGLENFVFGLGRFDAGIGVYSFHRFWVPGVDPALYLRRSVQLLNHELGHGLGIFHCVYFRCSMNGSNSLPETDGTPPHVCPVCLRKLQLSCQFELTPRYEALGAWYDQHGLPEQGAWVRERLRQLEQAPLWREVEDGR